MALRAMDLQVDHGPRLLASVALFFAGQWSLRRRIHDRKAGTTGRLHGTARFTAGGESLWFAEQGGLVLAGAQMEARQEYHFTVEGPDAFTVRFADDRLFHRARLVSGVAPVAHDCAPDLYRGRYRILGPDRWSLGWRITGPRKDLVIVSVFSRAGVG